MKNKLTSLALLGASMGTGMLLGLAPITSVYAGTFNGKIVDDNGGEMGYIQFTWEPEQVTTNMLQGFESLTDFSFTNAANQTYDLQFAQNADFYDFTYNLSTNELKAMAIAGDITTATGRNGFRLEPDTSIQVNDNKYNANSIILNEFITVPQVSESLEMVNGVTLEELQNPTVDPSVDPVESVPENGLTTALLIIAGLVVLSPKKKI
jgi:hypothetical protein